MVMCYQVKKGLTAVCVNTEGPAEVSMTLRPAAK